MRYREIAEAPIADFEKIGHQDASPPVPSKHFHPADDKLLSSPKAIKKIHNAFARTPYEFNIYVVMPSEAKRLDGTISFDVRHKDLERIVGRPVETEGRITVVFSNNLTGANAMPMTAWTLAHRMGHAIQVGDREKKSELKRLEVAVIETLVDLYNSAYETNHVVVNPGFLGTEIRASKNAHHWDSVESDPDKKNRFLDMLTMKSARDKTFNVLGLEVFCELLAQYLLTGRVRLNAPAGFEQQGRAAEQAIDAAIETILNRLVGGIISF